MVNAHKRCKLWSFLGGLQGDHSKCVLQVGMGLGTEMGMGQINHYWTSLALSSLGSSSWCISLCNMPHKWLGHDWDSFIPIHVVVVDLWLPFKTKTNVALILGDSFQLHSEPILHSFPFSCSFLVNNSHNTN